jgi:glycosyltransferase involved in cell wall biosynthesis
MALATPVVATSKAVEGLDVRHGEHLLIADSPGAFARAVLQILREPNQARGMIERAFELVRARYNWQQVLPHFMQLVERAAFPS